MMSWLRRWIHRLVGRDRYHEQANAVQVRYLRQALLTKQLHVIERRGEKR